MASQRTFQKSKWFTKTIKSDKKYKQANRLTLTIDTDAVHKTLVENARKRDLSNW